MCVYWSVFCYCAFICGGEDDDNEDRGAVAACGRVTWLFATASSVLSFRHDRRRVSIQISWCHLA